ncbi:hypothetical protein P775_22760 [Puniceibacterium antarcticum]|uniref:Uncharacterized protein n=1 Tax=Puniceibacterium antarcticum TaxID=1206336 RepID=A0A2G8R8M7_9RHOB|nr:hypothetical protein P775_22760 [Puniceibacterium antarcticum]
MSAIIIRMQYVQMQLTADLRRTCQMLHLEDSKSPTGKFGLGAAVRRVSLQRLRPWVVHVGCKFFCICKVLRHGIL